MKREDSVADSINDLISGHSTVEGGLMRYPNLRRELSPLLQLSARIKTEDVSPSAEFKQRLRTHLLNVMNQPRTVQEQG